MSAQHTPGPWFIDCGALVMGGQTVASQIGPDTASYAELRANLHLIAAAPELLSALQLAVAHMESLGGIYGMAWLDAARTAIAKAAGSAP